MISSTARAVLVLVLLGLELLAQRLDERARHLQLLVGDRRPRRAASNSSIELGSTSSSGKTSVDSVRCSPSERIAARYSFWRITKRPMPTRPDSRHRRRPARRTAWRVLSGTTRYDASNINGLTSSTGTNVSSSISFDFTGASGARSSSVIDDVLAVADVVALDDVLARHFLTGRLGDLAVADARHRPVVELVERDALACERRARAGSGWRPSRTRSRRSKQDEACEEYPCPLRRPVVANRST